MIPKEWLAKIRAIELRTIPMHIDENAISHIDGSVGHDDFDRDTDPASEVE